MGITTTRTVRQPDKDGGDAGDFYRCTAADGLASWSANLLKIMPREIICLECSEARKEGKSPSRYFATRNKRTKQEKVEKMKFNKFLRRHTLHKEVKL
jgi:large subunit ribosomal protein L33